MQTKIKIILSGGGDEAQTKEIDEFYASQLPESKNILYIPVAWKSGDLNACYEWFKSSYGRFGFNTEMITDLNNQSFDNIKNFDSIYIGGGNTFSLMSDLRNSGFDKILKQFIESGKIVYGGSAGAIILGKNIQTASIGKDADENKVSIKNFNGLGLVRDFAIQCHYEENQKNELQNFSNNKSFPIIALSECTGLYVEDYKIRVLGGPAVTFINGKVENLV